MNTKERIAQVALKQAARRGFEAVSIRDIAGEVGIKESSVYFHYKNKQAIFDALLSDVRGHMEGMKARFGARFDEGGEVTEEAFVAVAVHYLHGFFGSEPMHLFVDMLSIERHASEAAAQVYRELLFEVPIAHQRQVFAQMQARGIFRPGDAEALAREYQYAVLGVFGEGQSDAVLAALMQRMYRRECVQ